jgi:hypothetical protein
MVISSGRRSVSGRRAAAFQDPHRLPDITGQVDQAEVGRADDQFGGEHLQQPRPVRAEQNQGCRTGFGLQGRPMRAHHDQRIRCLLADVPDDGRGLGQPLEKLGSRLETDIVVPPRLGAWRSSSPRPLAGSRSTNSRAIPGSMESVLG